MLQIVKSRRERLSPCTMSLANTMFEIRITKTALKDIEKLSPKMKLRLQEILVTLVANDPHQGKRLVGELEGNWSLRLNLKDRIVYSIDEDNAIVYVKRAKTHYGE